MHKQKTDRTTVHMRPVVKLRSFAHSFRSFSGTIVHEEPLPKSQMICGREHKTATESSDAVDYTVELSPSVPLLPLTSNLYVLTHVLQLCLRDYVIM